MPPPTKNEQFNALSNAISRVLTPVMLCMSLSIWFVNSLGDLNECEEAKKSRKLPEIELTSNTESTSSSSGYSTNFAIGFIAIFLVLVVALTFLIVWLYKSGRTQFIQIWLMIAVALILSYVGGIYIFDFCRSHCIRIDWITLVVAVWNFSIGGLFAVFGRVPRFINQSYLIIISALMAYIFRTLPGFAVWIILGLLVLWDLFAVLSPYGPLNILVEAARERDDELPALVYDTNPIAPGREPNTSKLGKATSFRRKRANTSSPQHPTDSLPVTNPVASHSSPSPPSTSTQKPSVLSTVTPTNPTTPSAIISATPPSTPVAASPSDSASPTLPTKDPAAVSKPSKVKGIFRRNRQKNATTTDSPTGESGTAANPSSSAGPGQQQFPVTSDGEVQVGTLGTHLKLGLGDFVFYSILVAQASRSGPMTTIASFVAILAGLCATLFLVTVMRKALPALPISITVGLISFFLTEYTVRPFAENLLPRLLFH